MFLGKQWLLMKSWRHQQYLQSGRQTPAPTHASGLSRHWDLQSTTQKKEIRRTVSFYVRQMNCTRSNFCGTQSKGVRVRKWSKDLSTRGIHFSLDYTNCIFALLKGMRSLLKRKFMRVPCASHVEIHAFCTSREANGKVQIPRLLPFNGGWKCMLCVSLNRQYSYSPTVLGRVGLDHECEAHAGTFSPRGQTNMKKLRLTLPNLRKLTL